MVENAEVSIPASARGCRLRCVACGTEFERAAQDFRCVDCGELLEVFLSLVEGGRSVPRGKLRTIWLERRKSLDALTRVECGGFVSCFRDAGLEQGCHSARGEYAHL